MFRISLRCLLFFVALPNLGCQTTTGSSVPTTTSELTFCDGAKPFYWSSKDTNKSIVQAKAHNAVGADACGWGKKP